MLNPSPLFYKSTIALALTAAFSQIVNAAEQMDQNLEQSISLIKQQRSKPVPAVSNPLLADIEQDIAVVLESNAGVQVTYLLPNSQFAQISVGGSMPLGNSAVAFIEDGINYAPLAYLDNSMLNISLASVQSLTVMHSPVVNIGPSGLGGGVTIARQQIPTLASQGQVEVNYGTHQQAHVGVSVGSLQQNWGSLFSFNRNQGDSYRVNQAGESGEYSNNDWLIRIKEIAAPSFKDWQQTELKIHYKDYRNNESRFGISAQDLSKTPMLRYMATELDNESQQQLTFHLKHQARLDQQELTTTDIYYHDGDAGYYQTASVNGLFGDSAATLLGGFEQTPSGNLAIDKYGLERSYSSWGIQFKVEQQLEKHQIEVGIRYHTESMTDRQWTDQFNVDQQLQLSQLTAKQNVATYKDSARVKSVFITDGWQSGALFIKLGARYEQIEMRREQSNIFDDQLGTTNQNVTILSADIVYQLDPYWSLTASGHQGYQALRSSMQAVDTQDSLIARVGVDFSSDLLSINITAFNNNYDNLSGRCRAPVGCSQNQLNYGQAEVSGLELTFKSTFEQGGYQFPIELAYTYNDAKFESDFNSLAMGWQISRGDLLPYIPENHLYVKLGMAAAQWQVSATALYRDDSLSEPAQNYDNINRLLEDVTLINLAANYQLTKNQRISLTVNNVTDQVYVEAAVQAGQFVGRERTFSLGYKYLF